MFDNGIQSAPETDAPVIPKDFTWPVATYETVKTGCWFTPDGFEFYRSDLHWVNGNLMVRWNPGSRTEIIPAKQDFVCSMHLASKVMKFYDCAICPAREMAFNSNALAKLKSMSSYPFWR